MNVLIITSWYPNKKSNINGIFVKDQVIMLKQLGINPIVFYPLDNEVEKSSIIRNVEDNIVTYRANTYYLRNSKISLINSIIKSVNYVNYINKKEKIELIHAHVCYPAGIIAFLCKIRYNINYIITEHMSSIPEYAAKFYNKFLLRNAYESSYNVITVSKALEVELKKIAPRINSIIIPNVVDVNVFNLKVKKWNANLVKILFIGSMDITKIKGINFLLESFSELLKIFPNKEIELNIIGDGEMKKYYQALSKELGIMDKCNFIGNLSKNLIPQYIQDNDFLVLPSIKETFGCVLIEAMACGKPVLSTRCGGPEDIVNNNVGILVEPNSSKELTHGFVEMIENYTKYDPINIRNYAINNYSSEEIGKKLILVYDKILLKRG